MVTTIFAPPTFWHIAAKSENFTPPLPLPSFAAGQSRLVSHDGKLVNQLVSVNPFVQAKASSIEPPGYRSQPGDSVAAIC